MKSAYVTATLKKADLDPPDAKSYRLISKLAVLSKSLERLESYHRENDLLPDRQSAYRAHHSTETAVLRVIHKMENIFIFISRTYVSTKV